MEVRAMIVSENTDYLAHYGVLGMKWGVRNAETQRKYASGSGKKKKQSASKSQVALRAIGTQSRKAGAAVAKTAKKAGSALASKASTAVQQKVQTRKMAREYSSTSRGRKEFMKLRAQTLRAHDPELVAKGVHTLTDSELTAKITRLQSEQKIRDMAMDNRKKRAEVGKAENEHKNSSLGRKLLATMYNSTINYAGKKAVDKGFGLLETYMGNNSQTANKESKTKTADTASPPIQNETKNEPKTKERKKAQKKAKAAGKKVVDDIINIEPVSVRTVSSEPSENEPHKSLPSGR